MSRIIGRYLVIDYPMGNGCDIYVDCCHVGCVDNVSSDVLDEDMIDDMLYGDDDDDDDRLVDRLV